MRRPHDRDAELDRFAKRPPQQVGEVGDERTDVGRLRIERLAPAESEKLGRQLRALLRRLQRLLDMLALLEIGEIRMEHLQIGDDRRQVIVEIMRDAAGELADRLHLLRLPELLLHLLAARQVADEAGEYPLSVGARFADGELHREDRAVLGEALHQTAIADDPRFARLEVIADVAVVLGSVGLGHEHPDVAAEHFLRMIAEQLRRCGAEGGHQAPLVDDDHRLGDCVEDRSQMRLARLKLRLGALQSGDVAVGLQHEADRPVVGLSRDPEARDADGRSVFRLVLDLAPPAAAVPERRDDLAARQRISGLQERVDRLSDGLLRAPAVETLAAGRPVQNPSLGVMDDDVGEVEDICQGIEFGVHCRSRLFRVVVDTRLSLMARLSQTAPRVFPPADQTMPRPDCHQRRCLQNHAKTFRSFASEC